MPVDALPNAAIMRIIDPNDDKGTVHPRVAKFCHECAQARNASLLYREASLLPSME